MSEIEYAYGPSEWRPEQGRYVPSWVGRPATKRRIEMKPTSDAVSKPGSHTKGEINQISKPLPDASKKGASTIVKG